MKRLTKKEVSTRLEALGGWEYLEDEGCIARKFVFDSFDDAISFIQSVAELARELSHFPELHNLESEVAVSLYSYEVDGLSAKDFELAEKIEQLLEPDSE